MKQSDNGTKNVGGIMPLFSGWTKVGENQEGNNVVAPSTMAIIKYLMRMGFTEAPMDVLNSIAVLVSKSVAEEDIAIGKEYIEMAKHGTSNDATRAKMTYYMQKNYDQVRMTILTDYGCDIGKNFSGNKNFIKRLAVVYATFVR